VPEYIYNGPHIICICVGEEIKDMHDRHKVLVGIVQTTMKRNRPNPNPRKIWSDFWYPMEHYTRPFNRRYEEGAK
jgi:hypothetical protein